MLVLLTSGVVGLAMPKTSYGLEICTSLKCVDRGRRKVEGVERKKKALLNPRKQTTGSRRSRDSRDSTIIRLRFQKHNFKAIGDANYNDIKTTSSETVSIIWDRIGLGFSNSNYQRSGNYPSDQSQSWKEGYWVQLLQLSYTFGTDLTLTLGTTVWSQGFSWLCHNESFCYQTESLNPTKDSIDHYIDSISIGFRVGSIEFLIGSRKEDFKFGDYQCNTKSSCSKTISQMGDSGVISDEKEIHDWIDFGIGVTF